MRSSVNDGNLHRTRFETSGSCFEDGSRPMQPMHVVDVRTSAKPTQPQSRMTLTNQACSNLEMLAEYLDEPTNENYRLRFISLCQTNSWSRLQVTKPMLEKIIAHHDVEPEFLEVPLCFFDRLTDEEQSFCVPWTMTEDASSFRMFYTFRYAEYKGLPNEPWVIRQAGVYHKFDVHTKRSLFIVINAVPDSKAYRRVIDTLSASFREVEENPLCLHNVIHSSYFAHWRDYLGEYERSLLPIADTTTATFIDEPLRVTHNTLGKVRSLESRFLPLQAILGSFDEVISELENLSEVLCLEGAIDSKSRRHTRCRSQNMRRYCQTYARTALFLQQRSNNTATLLSDTLGYRNQAVAQDQNGSMIILTRSAVFITIITLVYLPWTLITGIFGMEFFEMDQDTQNLEVSPQIWQFFVAATGTTVLTMLLYYLMAGFPRIHRQTGRSDKRLGTTTDERSAPAPITLQRQLTDIEKRPWSFKV